MIPVVTELKIDWRLLLVAGVLVGGAVWYSRRQIVAVAEALDPTDPNNVINTKVHAAIAPALGTNKLTGKQNTIGSALFFKLDSLFGGD